MKRNLYVGRILLALVPLLTSPTALALANRVFVSQRSGNDANSCDNILTPCQTFAGAVLQLNSRGEAIVLDSGGYGPVTITKAVTIEAPPGVLAFIHPPSGDAVTVNAGASDTVVLRGLTLNAGAANGITFNSGASLSVESCTVNDFGGDGIRIAGAGMVSVVDSAARANYNAINVTAPTGTVILAIEHCRLELSPNRCLEVVAGAANLQGSITNSLVLGNFVGFEFGSSGGQTIDFNIDRCTVEGGVEGIAGFGTGTTVRVANSVVTANSADGLNGAGVLSRGDNTVRGNSGCDTCSAGSYTSN